VYNNGSQYNLGFLIGVALVFLLLGIFAGRRRHHK
jgi:LPXTG-motif cell wall-anchored protein